MKTLRRIIQALLAILLAVISITTLGAGNAVAEDKGNPGPSSPQSDTTISGSPLSITVRDSLAMGVTYNGARQFYANFASGTFIAVDGQVFGPEPPASGVFDPIPYTVVSNTGPTGAGIDADPFKIVAVARAGSSGIEIRQETMYVNGAVRYRNDYTLTNSGSAAKTVQVFHAADFYLNFPGNQQDYGYGFYDPASGTVGALSQDRQYMQAFTPVTPASAYQEAAYDRLWKRIGGPNGAVGSGFNNTVNSQFHDVAAGVQWNLTVDPGASVTLSHYSTSGPASAGGASEEQPQGAPFLTIAQKTTPNAASRRNGIVTYDITVTNRGDGGSQGVKVTMPFDLAEVQVLDAVFSQPSAWVTEVTTDTLVFETDDISPHGGVMTATIRLATLSGAVDGAALGERLVMSGHSVVEPYHRSNLPTLTVSGVDQHHGYLEMTAASGEGGGDAYTFSSDVFAPREPVTLWYHTPDGRDVEVTRVTTDDDGGVSATFSTDGLTPGVYLMVAYGNWSDITAGGMFEVK